ncbi:hypothetical protein PAMP_005786 [Pampus punctatissimus]
MVHLGGLKRAQQKISTLSRSCEPSWLSVNQTPHPQSLAPGLVSATNIRHPEELSLLRKPRDPKKKKKKLDEAEEDDLELEGPLLTPGSASEIIYIGPVKALLPHPCPLPPYPTIPSTSLPPQLKR